MTNQARSGDQIRIPFVVPPARVRRDFFVCPPDSGIMAPISVSTLTF
jgi:hypothetical protein